MSMCQVLLMCTLLGTTADANGLPVASAAAPRWEIAPEVSWFRYEEPGIMKNEGLLYGVAASYTRYGRADHPQRLLRLEGEFAVGQVDYEGALMDGTPYSMGGNDDILVNVRALWGRFWRIEGWEDQVYAGLGYRFLNDDSTQDPAGYQRYSNYLYLPLALRAYHSLRGNWQIGLGAEFDMLLIGLQISGIAESETDSSNVDNWQWPGFGARGAAELRHRSETLDLAIAPFIQYWWVDDSYVSSGGWYEPRNSTLQYGLNLVWRF